MRWPAGVVVVLLVAATGCATPSSDPDPPASTSAEGPGTEAPSTTSTSPTSTSDVGQTCGYMSSQPCACPWVDGCEVPGMDENPDVALLVNGSLVEGGMVSIEARNDGSVAYVYRTYYAACDLGYYTEAGRRFLIPEGTHCDIANTATLEPGQTVRLFSWDLDECVEDHWGCGSEHFRDLPPGTYFIRGTFCQSDGSAGGYARGNCEAGESSTGLTLRID